MKERKNSRAKFIILIGLLLTFMLPGCSSAAKNGRASDIPSAEPVLNSTATDAPLPTETPLPARLVLVTAGMDENSKSDLAASLTTLASENGLVYEERAEFQAAELSADWRVVVMMAPETGLPEAVTANPGTQFIVYSDQELTTSANLSVIRLRRDRQAFLAGYLSTLITPDWRTAGLFAPDAAGDAAEQAFINGGEYLCGLCNPYYAPLVLFPISARVSGSADASAWQADLDKLLSNIIYTVYVSPQSESSALWDALAAGRQILVGGGNPPQALAAQWAATVMLDLTAPLQELWPDVMAGTGGKSLETPVRLTNINENYLTPGRQIRVDEVMKELDSGWIHPLDIAD